MFLLEFGEDRCLHWSLSSFAMLFYISTNSRRCHLSAALNVQITCPGDQMQSLQKRREVSRNGEMSQEGGEREHCTKKPSVRVTASALGDMERPDFR